MKKNKNRILIHLILIILCLSCLIPFLLVISISFSQESDIIESGYRLIPKNVTLDAYKYVFKNMGQINTGYVISIVTTVCNTALGVVMMSMVGYAIARKNFKLRKPVSFIIFFTMLFSGGLVPSYILVTQYLRLDDTILILILSGLVSPFYIVVLRTFFSKLPDGLFESAKIDGANEFFIYMKIALPMSTPAIATVALISALAKWNDWFTPMLYIKSENLMPLQFLLYRAMADLQFIAANMQNLPDSFLDTRNLPTETARMAMCIIAAGPIMFVFPFFQKYFVKGLTVGAIKE